jgi:hypothetical protein
MARYFASGRIFVNLMEQNSRDEDIVFSGHQPAGSCCAECSSEKKRRLAGFARI